MSARTLPADRRAPRRPEGQCALRIRLAGLLWGWVPHQTQRQWLMDDSDVKVAACGRRWGKTEAQAVDAATWALVYPGSEQMIVAPTYDQARLIAGGVERLLLGADATRPLTTVRRTPYSLIGVRGSRISARSADDGGRSLRGHRADRVIVDEAAFVEDAVVTDVIMPMLADCCGQLILISTPWGRNHFWRAWMAGGKPGSGVRAFRFPSSANPHISADYVERQRGQMPERAFRAEYLAEFVDDASCVFPWADIRACQEMRTAEASPAERLVVAGIDWARHADYTVCVAMDAGRTPWRLLEVDRFQGLSWDAAVRRVADFLAGTGAQAALCDATSVGDPLLEQLRRAADGVDVEGLVFTSTSKRDLVDNLALRLAHREIALPPPDICHGALQGGADLLRELEIYEYHLAPRGGLAYSAPAGRHDDCVMALALAAWQARALPEFTVHAMPRARRQPGDWPLP